MRDRLYRNALLLGAAFGLLCLPAVGLAQQEDQGYRDFAAVERQLKAWAGQHPELMQLQTIGSSAGGRPIYVARLATDGELEPARRPAVFVGANIVGYHNAGSEAALNLLQALLDGGEPAQVLSEVTFYIAPALDPDAHDGMFGTPKQRLSGNDSTVDRDVDGLDQEDGPNDLNGDGRITRLRIPDPEGKMLPDPDDPRVMIEADPLEGQTGAYRVVTEGRDDDEDGRFNEDGPGGVVPNKNFAHEFRFNDPEAGPWPSYAPESKALMDFLLARRNVALALVYGPANNLLALPQGFGGGGDPGTLKFKVPRTIAEFIGLDPEQEYTIDEIWELVKDLPFVVQNNITKEQVLQFLGAGPATKPEDADIKYLEKLAEEYKKRLEDAGLDNKRKGAQYTRGGLTPWLYYQHGAMAIELDVWGVPKAEQEDEDKEGEDKPLTLDTLAEMSSEEFLALGEEKIAAFLKEIGAPPQITASALIQRVESGQVTPKQMAEMARRMSGGSTGEEKKDEGHNDLMTFIDEQAPDAFVPWTQVTLPDGTEAEVGGPDPFIEIAPPYALLEPALKLHTETALDLAGKLARVEILKLEAEDLGGGVHRVKAVAGNRGFFPTQTKMAERAKSHLPVRLELTPGDGAVLVTGARWVTSERLEGQTGTLAAEWLVRVSGKSAGVTVEVFSDNAGSDRKQLSLGKGS